MERVEIVAGDIFKSQSDVVVYVTNTVLAGGTDGSEILWEKTKQSEQPNALPEGQAVVLLNKEVTGQQFICASGPQWTGGKGNEVKALAESYRLCFQAVKEQGVQTFDVPSIPTGIYDSQLFQVATIVLRELDALLKSNPVLKNVRIVCQDEASVKSYMQAYNFWFAVEKEDRMKFD